MPEASTVETAIVPAAGEGTRLRPLTDDRPKPLVQVAGRPLLAHVFDALAPIDPEQYVVIVGYRGEQVRERFGEAYRGTPIAYVEQPEPTGLADAVGRAGAIVDGPALVCNGDNVFADDLAPLASAFEAAEENEGDEGVAATLLVEDATVETARETGVVVTERSATGGRERVERVVEKPAQPPSDSLRSTDELDRTSSGRTPSTLVNAGAYAFSPAIFDACEAIEPADTGEYELADAITWLIEQDHAVEVLRYVGERVNVNDEDDLERAAKLVESR